MELPKVMFWLPVVVLILIKLLLPSLIARALVLLSTRLTARLLFKVVVPVPEPRVTVLAAPPMLRVETPELRRLKVLVVEVRLLPLTARSEESVTAPVKAEVPWIVRLPKAWISPELSRVVPLEPYPPLIVTELKLAAAFGALMVVALGSERVRLLMDAVPVVAPIFNVVAAPPMFKVVAVVLKRFPVVAVVAIVPEFAFTLPVNVDTPVTPRVPPSVVAPVPTEKVLAPVTEVLPLRETPPVPVEKVVDPV